MTSAEWPGEMVAHGAFAIDAGSLPRVLDELPYRTAEAAADRRSLPF